MPLLLLLFLAAPSIQAQDVRYISDEIFVVMHRGPGTEYRWRARLTPGTRLTLQRMSDDGKWAEVSTDRGTSGWVQAEYLSSETPAQLQLPEALQRAEGLDSRNRELDQELQALQSERDGLLQQISDSEAQLRSVTEELTQLKQISGKAVQLDGDNRRLVEEAEDMRAQLGTLQAENQRLNDKLRSEDFINGALAVLLGVIITLVVPRLWPKRRRSSSWA